MIEIQIGYIKWDTVPYYISLMTKNTVGQIGLNTYLPCKIWNPQKLT